MDTNRLMLLMPDMAVFCAVVDGGNFTVAAQKIGTTPSAVSRKISRLEDRLKCQLFQRSTRHITLTDFGKQAHFFCQQMLESAQEVTQLSNTNDASGQLTIAMPKAFGKHVMQPHLLDFSRKFPDVRLHLKVSDQFFDPIKDNVDIIFRLTDEPIEGLVSRNLGRLEQIIYATPEYLASAATIEHPSQLKDHRCLYLGENPQDRIWHFHKDKLKTTVKVSGKYIVNHSEMRLSAVKNHFGIGLLPQPVAQQDVEAGNIVQVLPNWQIKANYQGNISMQYPQTNYRPLVCRLFIDYIVDKAATACLT